MVGRVVAIIVSVAVGFGFQIPIPRGGDLASIQGQVTDSSGQPIRKAGVTLKRAGGGTPSQASYTATTDTDGRYSFDNITPGGYTLDFERVGYLRRLYRTTPHEVFSTITVNAGQHLNPINVVLTRAVTISGRVLDEDGDPVANVPVHLLHRTWGSGLTPLSGPGVFTDESGNYRIPGLSPGRYYLRAGENRGPVFSIVGGRFNGSFVLVPPARLGELTAWYATTFYPAATDELLATPIQIRAGQTDLQRMDILLRNTPAFQVTGKIVGALASHPIEQCQVVLAPVGAALATGLGVRGVVANVAKDGSIDFRGNRFRPGEYFIRVTSGPPGRQIVLASQRLVIGDRDINAVLNLQPLMELRGKVMIEGAPQTDFSTLPGTPPPSVTMQILLYSPDSPSQSDLRSKITNDGSFTIGDIAPGTWEVRVCCIPGGTWVKSIQLGSQEARDDRIDIPAGTSPGQLQITLSRSVGHIAGIVETDQGRPAGGGVVTLISYSPGPGKPTMTTGIDSNGRFNLAQVGPGTYRLYAWDDIEIAQQYDPDTLKAWESNSLLITVRESANEEVTLKQIPAPAAP